MRSGHHKLSQFLRVSVLAMSRTQENHDRRGCSGGDEAGAFAPVEVEEIQAVIRFWHRRLAYSIIPMQTVNGESDFEIDMPHLVYAISRIRYYESLLAKSRPVALELSSK
jgi:hypothetical protein